MDYLYQNQRDVLIQELFKDVKDFLDSYINCQIQTKIKCKDGLWSMYFSSIYFQWKIDLVAIPCRLWSMRYLVLIKKELSNFIEGRTLRTKFLEGVCWFILEDIFSRFVSIRSMKIDRRELNRIEKKFFKKYGV